METEFFLPTLWPQPSKCVHRSWIQPNWVFCKQEMEVEKKKWPWNESMWNSIMSFLLDNSKEITGMISAKTKRHQKPPHIPLIPLKLKVHSRVKSYISSLHYLSNISFSHPEKKKIIFYLHTSFLSLNSSSSSSSSLLGKNPSSSNNHTHKKCWSLLIVFLEFLWFL